MPAEQIGTLQDCLPWLGPSSHQKGEKKRERKKKKPSPSFVYTAAIKLSQITTATAGVKII